MYAVFEPTCANLHGGLICIAFCLSVLWTRPKVEKIIHISISMVARGMNFGQNMDVGHPKVCLEGQGHRSKFKVTRSKNVISGPIGQYFGQNMDVDDPKVDLDK